MTVRGSSAAASYLRPRAFLFDGSFLWWGGRGSLIVTDGAGRDVKLPDKVRYYLVPGTQHGGGACVGSGVVGERQESVWT